MFYRLLVPLLACAVHGWTIPQLQLEACLQLRMCAEAEKSDDEVIGLATGAATNKVIPDAEKTNGIPN